MLSPACPADHLRPHSGPGSSSILLGAPNNFEVRLIPEHFRTLVLGRLRLPLLVVEARCECGMLLDSLGRHRAACPRSGRLRRRAMAPEKALARVCREAGATVRCTDAYQDIEHPILCLSWNQEIVYCTCGQFLVESEFRKKFDKLRLDALYPALRDQERALPWCSECVEEMLQKS